MYNAWNEKYVQCGAFVSAAMIFTDRKRRVIHSDSARHGLLFRETWRSHTDVDEDYALSAGEGLRTVRWNVVHSSWTVGPEDEGKLTIQQGETFQMTW